MTTEKRELLYKIARDYYLRELTQQKISRRYGLSRVKVSRLLQKARSEKLVEISIRAPKNPLTRLEADIADLFGLDQVLLASSAAAEGLPSAVGKRAAEFFLRSVEGSETVALTWGASLSAFVQALPERAMPDLRIVQMLGGLGSPEAHGHASDLVGRMAAALGASGRILPAPGIVASSAVRHSLLEDPEIAATLARASEADLAFVGIGIVRDGGFLPPEETRRLRDAGVSGDISLRFFGTGGEEIADPLRDRIIGLSLEEIRRIPRVVAVAYGEEKHEAVLAAVSGGLVHTLISDQESGQWLLEQADKE